MYKCVFKYMLRAGPIVFPVTCGASPTLRKPSPCRRPREIEVHLFTSTSSAERITTGRMPEWSKIWNLNLTLTKNEYETNTK